MHLSLAIRDEMLRHIADGYVSSVRPTHKHTAKTNGYFPLSDITTHIVPFCLRRKPLKCTENEEQNSQVFKISTLYRSKWHHRRATLRLRQGLPTRTGYTPQPVWWMRWSCQKSDTSNSASNFIDSQILFQKSTKTDDLIRRSHNSASNSNHVSLHFW